MATSWRSALGGPNGSAKPYQKIALRASSISWRTTPFILKFQIQYAATYRRSVKVSRSPNPRKMPPACLPWAMPRVST